MRYNELSIMWVNKGLTIQLYTIMHKGIPTDSLEGSIKKRENHRDKNKIPRQV